MLALLFAFVTVQLDPWPAGAGTEIGGESGPGGLPAGFETSGVVWHPGRNSLVVVSDGGLVAELPPTGGAATVWSLPGDLEAVTLADPASDLVYVGVEHPDGVVEFDLSTGLATGNTWNLTPWMTGPANEGLEALAYVEGDFHAGLQLDGTIFRFELLPGGVVQLLGSFASHLGRSDLSGLDYDACSGVLYALHDIDDVIVEYDAGGVFLREYDLAGSDQEGVALMVGSPAATTPVFIAQDTGELYRYESYPVAICPPGAWSDLGGGTPGSEGVPTLAGSGPLQAGWPVELTLTQAPRGTHLLATISFTPTPQLLFGGTLHTLPFASQFLVVADVGGSFQAATSWPAGVPPGAQVWFQFLVKDSSAVFGLTLSNGLRATAP